MPSISWCPKPMPYRGWKAFNLMIRTRTICTPKSTNSSFPKAIRAAFVGSANLSSKAGLKNNAETVAFFSEKEDNYAMGDEIDPLAVHANDDVAVKFDQHAAQSNDDVAAELDRLAAQAFAYPVWKIHNNSQGEKMTSMMSITAFGLKENPFSTLPGAEVKHLGRHAQNPARFERRCLQRPSRRHRSQRIRRDMHGDWGSGKTHALRYFD